MKLLLDTHIILWLVQGSERLPPSHRIAIEDPANDLFLSSVCAFEIATKHGLGKLQLALKPTALIEAVRATHAMSDLPIVMRHALVAGGLPPHHRDPFDRLLIAQAMIDGLTVVSIDSQFTAYGVPLLGN